MSYANRKAVRILAAIASCLVVVPGHAGEDFSEYALLRLYQLEKRFPATLTYSVPANIDSLRILRGHTIVGLMSSYLENCRQLAITPLALDREPSLYRELMRMQLIWLGAASYPGYAGATYRFFASVDSQLIGNPEVRDRFQRLFRNENGYVTRLWDFVRRDVSSDDSIDLQNVAKVIGSLSAYRSVFENFEFLEPSEWTHPAFLFHRLDFYRERQEERFRQIMKEARASSSSVTEAIERILTSYEKGRSWLEEAGTFFLQDRWFFDEDNGRYVSLWDVISDFWGPCLDYCEPRKVGVLRFGEVDATIAGSVPWAVYPHLLRPLNSEGERFLMRTPARTICSLFQTIGDTIPEGMSEMLPEQIMTAPLNRFIHDLEEVESRASRFTEAFDIGCPITVLISNLPHEIAHSYHFREKPYWKKAYAGGTTLYYQVISNYIDEGIAELAQVLSIERILRRYPILRHDNLLKHYIYCRSSPGNHHTWGLLWLRTAYEAVGEDFCRLFFLACEPGISIDEFLRCPAFQSPAVHGVSTDTRSVTFERQKSRRPMPKSYTFPACTIRYEEDRFRVLDFEDWVFEVEP